jgi:response regulator RpfG family c-di-GMP phosphodiesterase
VTTRRAYQQSRTGGEAIGLLRSEVEKGWRDHDLVEEFVTLITEGKLPA